MVHQPGFLHVLARVFLIDGRGLRRDGPGLLLPRRRLHESVLQVADAGEVLIEPLPVARADLAPEPTCLLGDGVHDALAEREPPRLRLNLRRGAARKSFWKTSDGLLSGGIATPVPVNERLR